MWVKFDVRILRHPQVVECSSGAKILYISSILYCAEHNTGGKLRRESVELLLDVTDTSWYTVGSLLAARLWERDEDGFKVLDIFDDGGSQSPVRETT